MKVFIVVFCIVNLAFAGRFGSAGRDGRDGSHGYSGRDGSNIVIHASDVVGQSFNLSGSPGGNASNGELGGDASSCHFNRRAENMYGADGGDGGNGGNAGRGGDGGNTTIFYKNLSELKTIQIISKGARSGHPAFGASAGRGCRCSVGSWSVERCRTNDEGERRCTSTLYRCYSGDSGSMGRDGQSKSSGSNGRVVLIKGSTINYNESRSNTLPLDNSIRKNIILTENIWLNKKGALALLASGSVVNNNYVEYSHRVEKRVHFQWDSEQNIEDFKENFFSFSMNNGIVSAHVDERLAGVYALKQDEKNAYLRVEELFKIKDLHNFEKQSISGIGSGIELSVQNKFHELDKVKTSYYITVATKKAIGRTTVIRYQGKVADEFITIANDGSAVIRVGDMPFSYKDKKKKSKLRITVVGINEYQGKEYKKEMDFYYKVGYSGEW